METLTLSPDQAFALRVLNTFATTKHQSTKPYFTLGGYAGTGKTTVIKELLDLLDDADLVTAVVAFTGKAASVLRKKGVGHAQTLHSLMYKPILDSKGNLIGFRKRSELLTEGDEGDEIDVIIVDEASMIDDELNQDLLSFKKPVIYVGDPGQLPPVGQGPAIMTRCDYILTQIHRQALNSPIIKFSCDIRGNHWEDWELGTHRVHEDSFVSVIDKKNPMNAEGIMSLISAVDQVIVPYNKERISLNDKIRMQLGRNGLLTVGERIICLENNRENGVFNGQQHVIEQIIRTSNNETLRIKTVDDLGKYYYLDVLEAGFRGGNTKQIKYNRRQVCVFDYAYAITCHKSQGSEWNKVLVLESYAPPNLWEMRRWQYTAITRAAKELYYAR